MAGEGQKIWADGIDELTGSALEAKLITNPARSPFIPNSGIPDFLRTKIVDEVTDEFHRYAAVIADPSNPLKQLTVHVSDTRAIPFFEDLMKQFNIPGSVVFAHKDHK